MRASHHDAQSAAVPSSSGAWPILHLWGLLLAGPLVAQTGSVAGRVSDLQARPIEGARVSVVGGGAEVITDRAGRFQLDNLSGTTVSVRVVMIGFRPMVVTTRVGETDLQISLTPAMVNLEELVVTGTVGETRVRALGNAIAKVDASTVRETAPANDVGQLLNARAPGVVLATQSGIAGGGAKILIRGPASMTFDGNPLIYVDGIRVNGDPSTGPAAGGAGAPTTLSRLNDINPADIESIEVIKGPSAATLYGTEASNGVIQIITKRGRPGKARYDVRIRQGANWFVNPEGRLLRTYYQTPGGEIDSLNLLEHDASLGNPPVFRTGHLQGYGVDLSGGAESVRYFASLNYDRDEGVVTVNTAERKTGRLNLTMTPNDKFDVSASVAATLGHIDSYDADYLGALYYSIPQALNTPSRGYLGAPPDVIAATQSLTQDVDRYTASLTFNHRPTSWLSHRFTAGVDLTNTLNAIVVPRVPPEFAIFFSPTDALGGRAANRANTRYTTADYSATARFSLTSAIGSATSVGGQYYSRVDELTGVTGSQFAGAGIRTVSGATIRTGTDNFIENTTVGLFVQQQFDWRNRLFLTAALRGDANSAFGSEFKAAKYPKVSASWVISEEPFWKLGFINQLKVRAAYGQSGQQPSAFAAVRTYAPVPGINDIAAGTPQSPGNPNLGPERGKEIEVGFDAGLFGDRAGLTFTYYNRRTTNAIVLREVAPSSGFDGRQFVNAGELRNRGLEILVNARPIQTANFAWDLSLNLSVNDNEVIRLGIPGVPFLPVGFLPNRLQDGYPVGSYWSKRIVSAELGPGGIATNLMCDAGPGAAPEPCATAPQVFLGQPFAKTEGALTTTISLGQHFRLYGMADFKRGAKLLNTNPLLLCAFLGNAEINLHPERFPVTEVAECQQGLAALGTSLIQSANYVKLRELSVTYDAPTRWARLLGAAAAQITLGARNIHTWTGFEGLDPETSTVSSWLASEHTEAVLPLPTQIMTSIRLSF